MNRDKLLEELKSVEGIENLTEDNYKIIKENIEKDIKRTQIT